MIAVLVAIGMLAISLMVGLATKKWVRSNADFLVAGREVGTFVQFCSFASAPFAAGFLIPIPAFGATVGFWPAFWYLASLGLVFIFAGLTTYRTLRRSGVYTMAEWVEIRYGKSARTVVALAQFIGLGFALGANLFGMSALLSPALQWPFLVTLVVATVTCLVYMWISGAWGGTVNDTLQFIIGGLAFLALPIYLYMTHGGADFLATKLNVAHYLYSFKPPIFSFAPPPAALFGIIGWMSFSLASQHYFIKVASCRSEKAAVRGVIGGGIFVILFGASLALIGVYAKALVPGDWSPVLAFPMLVGTLPPLFKAVMIMAVLAAGLSTAAGNLMGQSALGSRDLYQGFLNPNANRDQMLLASKIFIVLGAAVSFSAAFLPGGPAPMLALSSTFLGCTSTLIVVGLYWSRATLQGATWGVAAGMVSGFVWRFVLPASYWSAVDSTYVSVAATLVVLVAVSLATKQTYGVGIAEPLRHASTGD
jgi:SSS family solute:Na+ symporter